MFRYRIAAVILLAAMLTLVVPSVASADANSPASFSVIIEPLPIVAVLNPGQVTNLQLKVINNNSESEALQAGIEDFKVNNNTGQIAFNAAGNSIASSWITLSSPKFTLTSGQIETENIQINTPKTAGFSYSLAVVISQQKTPTLNGAGQIIKGSVADFLLLNVNRPGVISRLQLVSLKTTKGIFGWLPVNFNVRLENTGNTILQPTGNIFIQRTQDATKPIDTISVNPTQGYILPGTDRLFTTNWSDGFPVEKSIPTASGTTVQHLVWNWGTLSKLRIGHYYGELVAIYNNGTSDVPVQGQVGFWVLPWMVLLVVFVLIVVLGIGFWTIFKKIFTKFRKKA